MNQVLHIFKKDVGFLRYHIALTLVAAAAFCAMSAFHSGGPGPTVAILPVTWWFLIAAVIHAEPLPGRGHFWLTRPYERKSLLAAKLLFILTFVNIPIFIADIAVVQLAGFSIAANIAGLLWSQVLLVAVFEIPAAAIASVTSGLLELLIATFFLILAGLGWILVAPLTHFGFSWAELDWVRKYYIFGQIAMGGIVILLCQYFYRATLASRIAATIGPVVLFASSGLISWTTAFQLQTHFGHSPRSISLLGVGVDSERKWAGRVYLSGNQDVIADVPLQVEGLRNGVELKPLGATIRMRTPGGQVMPVKAPPPDCFEYGSGAISLRVVIARQWYEKYKREPLQLLGTLFFAVYDKRQVSSIPLDSGPIYVGGLGLCQANSQLLACRSAFRRPAGTVEVELTQESPRGSVRSMEQLARYGSSSPFPADFNIDPVFRLLSPRLTPISDVQIKSSQPIAYSQKSFSADHFVLADYAFQK